MHVSIIWPERRKIPLETLSMWYHDAVANGELDEAYIGLPDHDWQGQARALSDAGLITLGRVGGS